MAQKDKTQNVSPSAERVGLEGRQKGEVDRGVATAEDASPVRPTMSPLHQNDNRQFVFGADFWRVTWRYITAYN